MADPKTVSNLPVDVSIRWAEDQKFLEETRPMISEADYISSFTQKDVSIPTTFSQLEVLLNSQNLHASWAMFKAPKGFFDQRKRLFTSRILPFLDSDEQIDDKMQKINSLNDKEEDQEEKERKRRLVEMLRVLLELNKNLTFVLSKRNQYQKG